jgi:hypothetical protein
LAGGPPPGRPSRAQRVRALTLRPCHSAKAAIQAPRALAALEPAQRATCSGARRGGPRPRGTASNLGHRVASGVPRTRE